MDRIDVIREDVLLSQVIGLIDQSTVMAVLPDRSEVVAWDA